MNNNLIALGAVLGGCGLAVFLPQWLPRYHPEYLGAPYVRFLSCTFGFIFGVYFIVGVASLLARRGSFSPSRVTLMAVLGAICGFVGNALVIPYLPPALRYPASGDNPLVVTSANLALSGFYLILPVVVAFLYIRIALAIHGKLSKLMRWLCVLCLIAILAAGYWFFGRPKAASPATTQRSPTLHSRV